MTLFSPAQMHTIARSLAQAQARGIERLEAQVLVLHALGKDCTQRAWLTAHDQESLPCSTKNLLEHYFLRRLAGEPVAYITGYKEFYGLKLHVDARVLVPRADTETLVDWALEILPTQPPAHGPTYVLDLGTGSGAIALALKHTRAHLHVHAVDISNAALSVARANAERLGLQLSFTQSTWLHDVEGKFHAIVANPPYIAQADEHLTALQHEPIDALRSGLDGLDAVRSIIQTAAAHLHPGAWLLLEHGYNQAAEVRALLQQAGFTRVQSRRDLASIERCSGGQHPVA